MLILQRTGLLGIKTALHRDLASWFSEKKLTLRMATLTDDDLLKAYLTHGTVDEILVATHKQSDDSRTLLNQSRIAGKAPPSGTKMEIRLSHDKGFKGALNAAAAAFRRSREVKDLVEVEGLDNPEEVAFRIDYGGQPKTFRILHPEEIGIKYDITRDVAYDKNNHPTFDSVNELAVKYCAELMERVNT